MSKRSAVIPFPRPIAPELVDVGDKIRVSFPPKDGMTMTHEGVVSEINRHGMTRYLYTDEGACIVAWEPGRNGLHILLLDRPERPQLPLWELDEEVAERLA